MYIHTCTYTYISMYTHTYIYIYIHTHILCKMRVLLQGAMEDYGSRGSSDARGEGHVMLSAEAAEREQGRHEGHGSWGQRGGTPTEIGRGRAALLPE